jgi:16S rRNA (uracil1498-N3)-methyltransferase
MRAPEVDGPVRLPESLREAASRSTHRIWLDEQPGAIPLSRAFSLEPTDSVSLFIGPEGGWIDAERQEFSASGMPGASLGPSILRAETAVCAALAVLSQMWLTAGS